jgi:hypothetical protein
MVNRERLYWMIVGAFVNLAAHILVGVELVVKRWVERLW